MMPHVTGMMTVPVRVYVARLARRPLIEVLWRASS
jgi:hypothetical protein